MTLVWLVGAIVLWLSSFVVLGVANARGFRPSQRDPDRYVPVLGAMFVCSFLWPLVLAIGALVGFLWSLFWLGRFFGMALVRRHKPPSA